MNIYEFYDTIANDHLRVQQHYRSIIMNRLSGVMNGTRYNEMSNDIDLFLAGKYERIHDHFNPDSNHTNTKELITDVDKFFDYLKRDYELELYFKEI